MLEKPAAKDTNAQDQIVSAFSDPQIHYLFLRPNLSKRAKSTI